MFVRIDTSVDNVPTSFSGAAGSLILTATSAGACGVINTTSQWIVVTLSSAPTAIPSSDTAVNTKQYLFPPSAGTAGSVAAAVLDYFNINTGDKVYIRTLDAPATSGYVGIVIW